MVKWNRRVAARRRDDPPAPRCSGSAAPAYHRTVDWGTLAGTALGALSLTTHRLRDLKRTTGLTREERIRQAGEILGSTDAYQLRYQMLIIAPGPLGDTANQAFRSVRDLRDRFDGPDVSADPEWSSTMAAVDRALNSLRTAMRSDLTLE